MSMREDIRKAINENLSQTIGEELRNRLDQPDAELFILVHPTPCNRSCLVLR